MKNVLWSTLAALSATALFADDRPATLRVQLLALAGLVLSALATQAWVLATARLQSKKIAYVSLGRGQILAEVVIGETLVQLRKIPGPLDVAWFACRAPLARLRVWLGTALSVVLQLAAGAWLLGTSAWPVGAAAIGATLVRVASTLRGPLGTGRILLVVPFKPSSLPLSSSADVRATTAVLQGRVADLRAAVPELTEQDRPDLDRGLLALAEGRYAEAEQWGRAATAQGWSDGRHSEILLVSSAIAGAADAGTLPRESYLPRLSSAMDAIDAPKAKVDLMVPASADLARFEDRTDDAVTTARRQQNRHPERLWRAEAACTLAGALTHAGQFDRAQDALRRAHRLCPGLARTAHMERLLGEARDRAPAEVTPATP
ncbi:hypothetical protein ABT263_27835 [Kitasatospora sp. NPDC001603]|uniref:hypothetical protein n=1 Tax=Kitasatospora sp. NPDC001603 TaxID=3154388 RepID=UPI00331CF5A8